ncbi:MAG TPA: formyltransferase [Burkholderiaceae bacterium]|nr:formyltransferase [Burkholderiaceae bacterium]
MRAVVFAYSNVGDRCLRVLHAGGVDIALVVTHHDQPGETLWFRRVADTATELQLPFVHADDPRDAALAARVAAARPDLVFSFYYRAMIPTTLLASARAGAFNMHGSLLPLYRGRAPVNWAVLHGATQTGATLHEMVAQPDAGAIVDQSAVPILPDDTAGQVFDKVTVAAEQVLWRSLPAILAGQAPRRPNDIAHGSYFGARRPEDGRIDWSRPAQQVYNLIRAVAPPFPGAFTEVDGSRLVVARARLRRAPASASAPGLRIDGDRIVGVCGDGAVIDIHELRRGTDVVDAAGLRQLLGCEKGLPWRRS